MSRKWRCDICDAEPGEPCMDTLVRVGEEPRPLARGEHLSRALPPMRKTSRTKQSRRSS